jgi:hypothetical protein
MTDMITSQLSFNILGPLDAMLCGANVSAHVKPIPAIAECDAFCQEMGLQVDQNIYMVYIIL